MKLHLKKKLPLKIKEPVQSIAVSCDGEWIILAQNSNESGKPNITLWATGSGKFAAGFQTEIYTSVWAASPFNKSNKLLFPLTFESLGIGEIPKGQVINGIIPAEDVRSISIDNNDELALIAGRTLFIWSLNESKPVLFFNEDRYVGDGIFPTPPLACWLNGNIVLAGENIEAGIYTAKGRLIHELKNSPKRITTLSANNNLSLIGMISYPDQKLEFWNEKGEKVLTDFSSNYGNLISSFTIQQPYLICGTPVGKLLLFDLKKGEKLDAIEAHAGATTCIACDAKGGIFSGGEDGKMTFCSISKS
jgi:WD40 repeat protein